jgi:hypothetical protein
MIAEMSQEYGFTVAQRAKSKMASNDLKSVSEYLIRIFDTVARGRGLISTVEENSDRIIVSVDRCPLDFEAPEMCMAHTMMEKTVVETLNPSLTYRIGKSIPAGHRCCEHILEKR